MSEPVQISTKRTPAGERYYIPVPADWAKYHLTHGTKHVIVNTDIYGGLEVTPMPERDVKEYRRQRRNQQQAERSRQRYRQTG